MNAWKIPDRWTWSTMGDIAQVVGGGTPKTSHPEFYNGDIPWITPADLSGYTDKCISRGSRSITQLGLDNSGAKLMPAGTVLFSSRAPIGYVAIATNPVSTNQGFKSFVLSNGLVPDFVYYYLKYAKKFAVALASGTTFLEISGKKAAQIPIPIPPEDDQRRIVAEIEKQFTRLDAGVAGLKRVQANLKRYRAAVLKAACEGKLVPTEAELCRGILTAKEREKGRDASPQASAQSHRSGLAAGSESQPYPFESGEQLLERILAERRKAHEEQQSTAKRKAIYKEPDTPDTKDLPELPEGWAWANLDSAIISGPQNGVYLPRNLYGSGLQILRIDDYQDGWVRGVDELNKVDVDETVTEKYQLWSGDLVINRVNSLTHLGKCLVVRESHVGSLFESNMMKAHLAGSVDPRYVEFYLWSRDGKSRLTRDAKWAVNQASINQTDVKRTPLPLPPLAEQKRIVEEVERRLSVIEEMEAAVAANLKRAARLRQSILKKAFEGKLV